MSSSSRCRRGPRRLGRMTPRSSRTARSCWSAAWCCHQPLACPVQGLEIELRLALQRDQPHGRPGAASAIASRPGRQSFAPSHRAGHTPATSAAPCDPAPEGTAEKVGAAASLHGDDEDRQFVDERYHPSRVIRRRHTTAPPASSAARLQLFLPRSIPARQSPSWSCPLLRFRRQPAPDGEGRAIHKVRAAEEQDRPDVASCARWRGEQAR